jgi:hypothetical protein
VIGNNAAANDTAERITYDYNQTDQLVKRTYYSNNFAGQYSLSGWNTYEYNANNKLIKINFYTPADPNAVSGFSTITYPAPDKLTMEVYSIINGVPIIGHRFENTYDNQKKPQFFVGLAQQIILSFFQIIIF